MPIPTLTSAGTVSSRIGNSGSYISPLHGDTMTAEEADELEKLKKEWDAQIESHKRDEFKKLTPEQREFVIQHHKMREVCRRISSALPQKNVRLLELERKQSPYSQWFTGDNIISVPLINYETGIPIEDMEKAHAEASMEEILLKGE